MARRLRKGQIKYYKPNWNIKDIKKGESLRFQMGKVWKVIGKTKKGYLKLKYGGLR